MEKELTLFEVPVVKSSLAETLRTTNWVKKIASVLGAACLTECRSLRKRRSGSFSVDTDYKICILKLSPLLLDLLH